jgi:hypothetical protein
MRLTVRATGLVGLFSAIGLALLATSGAQPHDRRQRTPAQDENLPADTINVVRQGFPANQSDANDLTKSETAWEVEWELTHPLNKPNYPPGCVLRIRSAKFMWKDKFGKPQWITIVRNLEPAEIYVPYDNGWTAFLDIHDMPFYMTKAKPEFLGPSCVGPGEILKSENPYWTNTVYKEMHDDGVRWMSAETSVRNEIADRARRGQKMILWSTYYGANYRYLIEFTFHDDGMIACRIGPTGRNFFNRREDLRDTHLHIGCWRMEMDMGNPYPPAPTEDSTAPTAKPNWGGPKDNEILLVRRVFDAATERFGVVAKPFAKNAQGQSCEGSAHWVPEEFSTLRMQSKVRKNSHGRQVCYDLIPQRYGALRQLQPEGGSGDADMEFINNDFWVTRTEPGHTNYIDVATYAQHHRPLGGYPTTIWHCTPALHTARGEDFGPENGKNNYSGLAITTWTGFYLKPRDLFDSTPLYKAAPWPIWE